MHSIDSNASELSENSYIVVPIATPIPYCNSLNANPNTIGFSSDSTGDLPLPWTVTFPDWLNHDEKTPRTRESGISSAELKIVLL